MNGFCLLKLNQRRTDVEITFSTYQPNFCQRPVPAGLKHTLLTYLVLRAVINNCAGIKFRMCSHRIGSDGLVKCM